MEREIERYRTPTRVLHWVIVVSFVILFLTGLVLFVPGLGRLAQDSWTRLLHRVAAVVFTVAPIIYAAFNWQATLNGIKDAFTWGKLDLGWLQAAPRYYFLCDEDCMPPQPRMNSGQKMWWLMVLVFGVVFVISGFIMWAFKETVPAGLLQWMVLIHDIAFIATGLMLFVHVYLSALHPLMSGALGSMVRGKVNESYVKAHHRLWYEEIAGGKSEVAAVAGQRAEAAK